MSDPIRLDPLPEYAVGTLDFGRIPWMLAATFAANDDDDMLEAVRHNVIRWTAEGPDDVGHYDVTVMFAPTGGVLGTTRVHWSSLAA